MSRYRVLPLLVLAGALLFALVVPLGDPAAVHAVDLEAVYLAPGAGHPFGTDQLGRDVWVRSAQALRLSLLLALFSSVASTVIGVGVGVAAASAGGVLDRMAMRLIDTVNAVPHLLLGVVVLALWPGNWWAIVASIALTHWTQVARIVRARLIEVREAEYVALSRACGASPAAIWFTHLVPAVAPQAAIALVLQLPHAIWHESALSFLGVGLPPQSASLGLLLEDARGGILSGAWWLLVFPAALLVLVSWAAAALAHPVSFRPAGPRRAARHMRRAQAAAARPAAGPGGAYLATDGLTVCDPARPDRPPLVQEVDYLAHRGAVNMILGPSGAGKSTLLRALSGLLSPQLQADGRILVDGRALGPRDLAVERGRRLVFVPGSAATALNPVRSVGAALGRERRRHGLDASIPALATSLAELDLAPRLLNHYPHELSGGQAQRVVLALGLVAGCDILVLDEPTSALDPDSAGILQGVLRRLADGGCTVIMVTHDRALARQLGDRVALFENGRLTAQGSVAELLGLRPTPPASEQSVEVL